MKRIKLFLLAVALLAMLPVTLPVSAQVSRGQFVMITLKASGAVTGTTVAHATIGRMQNFKEAIFLLNVTAVSVASPDRLDVYIQTAPDNTNYTDLVRFAQITTATAARVAQWQSLVAPTTPERAFQELAIGIGVNQGPAAQNWRVVSAASAAATNTYTYTLTGFFRE